ncbi:MAG: hypothetical protein WBE20_13615 [Candidatus Acidiferrales bacterium]
MDDGVVSLKGPVEKVGGKLVLRIPLAVGGEELIQSARGISSVEGDYLVIEIRDWLAEKLGITEGSWVHVHNTDGKFHIQPTSERDQPTN